MKALRLTIGLVFLFLLFNTLGFAQDPFSMKENYKIMPLSPSSGLFISSQEAVQTLPLKIGETKIELDRQSLNMLSQEQNKITFEYIGTQEKIQLVYQEDSIVIEYGGTTLTIDSNVDIGKIVIDETGVKIYDKDNKVIAFINKSGAGYALIDGMYVVFDKGTTVTLKGSEIVDMALDVNGDGKVDMADIDVFKGKIGLKEGDANWDPKFDLNGDGVITVAGDVIKYREAFMNKSKVTSIEVETEAGSYIVEKTTDGNIKITSAGGDTLSFNPNDTQLELISIKADGSATLQVWSPEKGLVEIQFDSKGEATSVTIYGNNLSDKRTLSLAREDGVKLNLTVNNDLSITIGSNVENSVELKYKQDGTVEAIKPDGTVIPIEGDIEKATFNVNGSVTINFKDGAVITINPSENPDNPGWWDGMTTEEIISTLQNLVSQGNLEEAAQKFSEIAGADLDLASQVMQGMQTTTAANIVNNLDLNLAVQVLQKLDSQKVAEILTAVDSGNPNYDARFDLNGDGVINLADVMLFIGKIGATSGDANYDARFDLNGDGVITVTGDALMLLPHIGASRGSNTPIISADKAGEILAAMDIGKAAEVLTALKPRDAALIVAAILDKQGIEKVVEIMKLMDSAKIAEILTVTNIDRIISIPLPMIYPFPNIAPIISAEEAGQILAAMETDKAADVLEAMKPQQTIPIIRAMLLKQGVQVVADIMKLMDPAKVAAIMAAPNWFPWPTIQASNWFLPTGGGLTVNECADILKAMGGLNAKETWAILSNLFKLNPWKAIQIYWRLAGFWPKPVPPRPLPRPIKIWPGTRPINR